MEDDKKKSKVRRHNFSFLGQKMSSYVCQRYLTFITFEKFKAWRGGC